jgi:hypothetical protein
VQAASSADRPRPRGSGPTRSGYGSASRRDRSPPGQGCAADDGRRSIEALVRCPDWIRLPLGQPLLQRLSSGRFRSRGAEQSAPLISVAGVPGVVALWIEHRVLGSVTLDSRSSAGHRRNQKPGWKQALQAFPIYFQGRTPHPMTATITYTAGQTLPAAESRVPRAVRQKHASRLQRRVSDRAASMTTGC